MHRLLFLAAIIGLVGTAITCAPPGQPTGNQPFNEVKPGKPSPIMAIAPPSLKGRLEAALDHVRKRDLMSSHSFWTIFHAVLGMGWDQTELKDEKLGTIKAIDAITKGTPKINGLSFIQKGDWLDVETMVGSGTGQGHQDQFVAEMAQWDLPPSTKFIVNGKEYKFSDFHKYSQFRSSIKKDQELSWAIVIVAQYFGTDASWKNEDGDQITLEDCVRYEVNQPIDTAACGGTHRLFGITWALHYHLKNGGKKTNVWQEAEAHLQKYVKKAKEYQNADGSFSSNYVSGKGQAQDLSTRISTSGHVLEWLALVLPDEELKAPWVQSAASAVSLMILETRSDPIEGGALYHAAHGLQIYRDRVFGPPATKDYRGPLIPLPPK